MRVSVTLLAACSSAATAVRLADVLAPDNEGGPRSLKFRGHRKGRSLRFDIESDGVSSLATALAVLNDVALFQEVSLLSLGSKPEG
ncbi:MAG: hypothetical protein HY296_07245 [Thaumarchaeota archaeon]|nr:hypothetical protein [Nitrososphaerota archaeon]